MDRLLAEVTVTDTMVGGVLSGVLSNTEFTRPGVPPSGSLEAIQF